MECPECGATGATNIGYSFELEPGDKKLGEAEPVDYFDTKAEEQEFFNPKLGKSYIVETEPVEDKNEDFPIT